MVYENDDFDDEEEKDAIDFSFCFVLNCRKILDEEKRNLGVGFKGE